jgi:GTP-binding protein
VNAQGKGAWPRGQAAPGQINVVSATFELGVHNLDQLPRPRRAELCVVGRSNVGKSSILNFLTHQRHLARVSNTPGRTRELNFFSVEMMAGVHRNKFSLVDLPGYGFAKLSLPEKTRLRMLLGAYFESSRGRRACMLLLDIRRDPSAEDRDMVRATQQHGIPTCAVLTKIDKMSKNQRKPRATQIASELGLPGDLLVLTSVQANLGREELLRAAWSLTAPLPASADSP